MKAVIRRLLPLCLALLSGCSIIDVNRAPPEGWPRLEPKIILMGYAAVQNKCGSNPILGLINPVFACAEVNLTYSTCVIYTMTMDEYVLEHEKAHCAGYDHVGGSGIQALFDRFTKSRAHP